MKCLFSTIFIFIFNASYSQGGFGFTDATIIFKRGDSLSCLIKREISYGDVITYMPYQDAPEKQVSAKEIKGIRFPFKYLENIKIDNQEKLLTQEVVGKLSLYNYLEIQHGQVVDIPNSGGGKFQPSVTILHYFVNSGDTLKEIKNNSFRQDIAEFISSCQSVVDKLDTQEYLFEDIAIIIKEYNSCK